jgi:hypothetical protein
MFITHCKTILIAIFAVVLFGCGGDADEAKKLGFASVDEMKEAHAKGWHTQQQYYKDNPNIARKTEANQPASGTQIAVGKNAQPEISQSKANQSSTSNGGWGNRKIGEITFHEAYDHAPKLATTTMTYTSSDGSRRDACMDHVAFVYALFTAADAGNPVAREVLGSMTKNMFDEKVVKLYLGLGLLGKDTYAAAKLKSEKLIAEVAATRSLAPIIDNVKKTTDACKF